MPGNMRNSLAHASGYWYSLVKVSAIGLAPNGAHFSNPKRERGRLQERFPFVSLAHASGYLIKVSAIGLAPTGSRNRKVNPQKGPGRILRQLQYHVGLRKAVDAN